MKGMAICKAYFEAYGRPLIEGPLASYRMAIAAGLVGEGSECFGFDDEFSRDHDFGPGFCLWIPEALYREVGSVCQGHYDQLPKEYMGLERVSTAYSGGRVGVLPLEGFYQKFTGLSHPPKDNLEWFRIPESFLATVTNGEVFMDEPGIFSAWRQHLLGFYPEDVMRKKLAARCAAMAQAGQYNYMRSMKRGDYMAAHLACSEFVKAAYSALYLVNGRYAPYYKWLYRGAETLSDLKRVNQKLLALVTLDAHADKAMYKAELIENICTEMIAEFNRKGFTRTSQAFMQYQAEELMQGIKDERLRHLHIMVDR